jgi:outer membrane immunogenic protein
MNKKQSLFAATAALAFAGSSALAADLPTKAPVYKAPLGYFSWSGCYIGGNVGAALARGRFTTTFDSGTHLGSPTNLNRVDAAGTGSDRDTSIIGGGQVGCNVQTGAFVVGAEGDFSALSTRPSITGTGVLTTSDPFSITNSVKNDWLATVRGRAGFAVDRSLFYVTGGAAFSRLHYAQVYTDTLAGPTTGGFNVSHGQTGWTIGGGWEYAFTNSWSIKAEYLHVRFSNLSATGLITAAGSGNTNVTHGTVREDIDIARLGLNYHFGQPYY